jgi:hypothetical protein
MDDMAVARQIKGMTVEAMPCSHGGSQPDYWVAVINNRIIFRTFKSANELFRFVDSQFADIDLPRAPTRSRAA